jgi:hypothetical protein
VGEFRAIPPLQEQIKGMASCPLIIRQWHHATSWPGAQVWQGTPKDVHGS